MLRHILAGAAAMTIDNARLYQEISLRQRWQEMSVETTAALLSGMDENVGLDLVVGHAREFAGADAGLIALITADGSHTLNIAAASGQDLSLLHRDLDYAGSLTDHALRLGEPLCLAGEQVRGFRSASDCPPQARAVLTVPLFARERPLGALILLARDANASFDARTAQMAAAFAAQAAIALELARARRYQEQVIALSSHEDLIRDLNDRVVSRLFTAGLQMHGLVATMSDAAQADRVAAVVDVLDQAIRDIREAVLHRDA